MSVLERARALARDLPAHRSTHDAERRLAPAVVAALRDGGLLDCLAPAALGGAELAPAAYVEVLEALATGDSATAWCVMTASTSSLLAGYLARDTAAAIWAGAGGHPFLAGVFAPSGAVTAAADGAVRLAGRWSYASGSRHADWFALGALDGKRHVVCFVPARDVRIADNWDTLGLAGTGSHDAIVDAVVPATHVTSVFDRAPWTDAALYRVPLFGLLAAGIAACGLGIARAALGHAAGKLKPDAASAALARYAALRAALDAARAHLVVTADDVLTRAWAGAVDGTGRGALRLAACATAETCAEVVRGAFHLAGGGSIRAGDPLNAAVRDIETVLTHRMVADRVRPAAARALLGLGAVAPDL